MLLLELPPDVVTSILCDWCEGISISTFLLTHANAMEFGHGALMSRMDQLAKTIPYQTEVLHVLALFREQMDSPSIQLYSEICAILDFFECQISHDIVYVGCVATSWGKLGVWLTTPVWSVNATHALFHDFELNYFAFERPQPNLEEPLSCPFGSLLGLTDMDARYVDRVRQKLEGYPEVYKRMLTPSICAFEPEPPLLFTTHSFALEMGFDMRHGENSLCCYWEDEEGFREDAIEHLADNIIRIMARLIESDDEEVNFRTVYRKKMGSVNVIQDDLCDSEDDEENDNHY